MIGQMLVLFHKGTEVAALDFALSLPITILPAISPASAPGPAPHAPAWVLAAA